MKHVNTDFMNIKKLMTVCAVILLSQPPLYAAKEAQPGESSIEQRIQRLERMANNQALIEMLQRIDSLQAEIRELRNMVEMQQHTTQSLAQRQRDLYLDSDRRLRELELGVSAGHTMPDALQPGQNNTPNTASPMEATTPDGHASTTASTTATEAEKAAYQEAFALLKDGRYEEAIGHFQAFLTQYPSGNYSDNALYWTGEANYVMRNFTDALEAFQKVVATYPSSAKVPDARLKIGYVYYELGEWQKAHDILAQLKQTMPNTTIGRLAEARLIRMKKEGH